MYITVLVVLLVLLHMYECKVREAVSERWGFLNTRLLTCHSSKEQ